MDSFFWCSFSFFLIYALDTDAVPFRKSRPGPCVESANKQQQRDHAAIQESVWDSFMVRCIREGSSGPKLCKQKTGEATNRASDCLAERSGGSRRLHFTFREQLGKSEASKQPFPLTQPSSRIDQCALCRKEIGLHTNRIRKKQDYRSDRIRHVEGSRDGDT
jgi:hypothetical protein